jgi:two-component system, OmpR family, sensor histidine kinase KdpD
MSVARWRQVAVVIPGTIALSYLCSLLGATALVAVMLLLFVVLLTGIYATLLAAVAASFAAAVCLDYFFVPPIYQITVNDLQGWLSLVIFLAVSLLTSDLSARLREQRNQLLHRQQETEKLHAFSRAMLMSTGEAVPRTIVNKCIEIFGFTEVALFESSSGLVQRSQLPASFAEEELRRVAVCGGFESTKDPNTTLVPISLGNKTFGSLGFAGVTLPATTLQALVNTVAVALAQAQAHEANSRAEAIRQSEELKSVMIDALAHDLKTPLTVIEAASDMLGSPVEVTTEQQRDLVRVVKQETKGLRKLIDEAIHLSRIDAKKLKLEVRQHTANELIGGAIESLGARAKSRRLSVEIPADLTPVLADRELIVQALKQLLDNALKYSAPQATVVISASESDDLMSISVRDAGRGLTEMEQSKIFEKFYRGSYEGTGIQGTGMGLAIAKEIVEAHGGSLSVESQVGQGSRFTITLRATAKALPVQS